ncbi:MAG: dipicolinate synthase subunit DpsA [Oscillospiraceae bacterium]
MKFAVIGGDMRIVAMACQLRREGHEVACFALDKADPEALKCCAISAEKAAENTDCVIFPLPVLNSQGLLNAPLSNFSYSAEEILRALPQTAIVCAGKLNEKLIKIAEERGLTFVDYFEREELVALNALATAEGALSLLLRNSKITVWDSRVLVIGFGRIGRMLASRLRALGAHVTVSARNAGDMAYIRAMGCAALDTRTLGAELRGFDTIINTVPARVLGERQLENVAAEALCIDLASRPGGIDMEAASRLNINAMWALGLPAETAPVTAGKIIKETVQNIMRELRPD